MIENKKTDSQNENCQIFKLDISTAQYDIYLNNTIDEAFKYNDLFKVLKEATDEDEVIIHINNGGGIVETTIQIINAMKDCEATVTTIVEGVAHSCASIIFLCGDEKIVKEHASMLCHYYSGGLYGKGNELEANSDFDKKFMKQFFRKIYEGFLTKKEIERMIKGEDFWLNSKQILKRLKNIK